IVKFERSEVAGLLADGGGEVRIGDGEGRIIARDLHRSSGGKRGYGKQTSNQGQASRHGPTITNGIIATVSCRRAVRRDPLPLPASGLFAIRASGQPAPAGP